MYLELAKVSSMALVKANVKLTISSHPLYSLNLMLNTIYSQWIDLNQLNLYFKFSNINIMSNLAITTNFSFMCTDPVHKSSSKLVLHLIAELGY